MKRIIRLDCNIKSNNKFVGHHWSRGHRDKKLWLQHLFAACSGNYPQANGRRMRVTITSYRPRKLDSDNMNGGCKKLLDAMKTLGMIVDDSPKWIEAEFRQEKIAGQFSHVKIELEPIEENQSGSGEG